MLVASFTRWLGYASPCLFFGLCLGDASLRGTPLAVVDKGVAVVEIDTELESLVDRLLKERQPPSRDEMIKAGLEKVNVKTAAQRLEAKLPKDISSMVKVTVGGASKASQPYSEASLAKALKYLNEMTTKAWEEMDGKLIECKEFEDRNRGSFAQVMTQIATIAESLAGFAKQKAEATEMINVREKEIISFNAMINKETAAYQKTLMENTAEMNIRKADLAVFSFMLRMVRCRSNGAFAQIGGDVSQICESEDGLGIDFGNEEIAAEVRRQMTPNAREAIREIIARIDESEMQQAADRDQREANATRADLLQKERAPVADDDDDSDMELDLADAKDWDDAAATPKRDSNKTRQRAATNSVPKIPKDGNKTRPRAANISIPKALVSSLRVNSSHVRQSDSKPKNVITTTAGLPTPPVQKTKVAKRPPDGELKCTKGPVDCGLLHDNFSLQWGKFKDLVDELQATMDKNEWEFKMLIDDLNKQMELASGTKAKFIVELNGVIASAASTQEDMDGEETERMRLEKEYRKGFKACKKRIEWIMFQDICMYIKVRSIVMGFSRVSPPEKIVDCGVAPWIPSECSVPCDDSCGKNKADPYACGGMQKLTRAVVVAPNKFGYACPVLSRTRKCNQVTCPVDCKMSKWSSWSMCTKACEGGAQSRMRNVLVQPKSGGKACNTAAETRPCNSGSCTRNCRLKKWSKWSPCSSACGGGFQERTRRVLIPIRGKGKCPKKKSKIRYGVRKCNTHKCVGDEICIAKQDLILAIDGSGSLRAKGFGILKRFAKTLVSRYQSKYYGRADMRIGIVQFGNGWIMKDGSVSSALEILPLSPDMKKVQNAIHGMYYLRGFTNMAQAFTAAEKLLLLGGRKSAQSAVMTITDGKPSFVFQTNEKVMQLRDKHVMRYFVPVTPFKGKELALMKKWASSPWPTNVVHIPGLGPLKADEPIFAQKCLVKFCPNAISPSSMETQETTGGYLLIREHGICGKWGKKLAQKAAGVEQCAALAEGAKYSAFSFGTRFARGRCYGMDLAVTKAMVAGFKRNRINSPCPMGKWKKSSLYDFYVIPPVR